jgi:hypothetical protein
VPGETAIQVDDQAVAIAKYMEVMLLQMEKHIVMQKVQQL